MVWLAQLIASSNTCEMSGQHKGSINRLAVPLDEDYSAVLQGLVADIYVIPQS